MIIIISETEETFPRPISFRQWTRCGRWILAASLKEETARSLRAALGKTFAAMSMVMMGPLRPKTVLTTWLGQVGRPGCADDDEKSGPAGCPESAFKPAVVFIILHYQ